MGEEEPVVYFVLGDRRVAVSVHDVDWLRDSWFRAEASQAGMALVGATENLCAGQDIRVTEPMRQVLIKVLDAVAADGRLNTGLRALRKAARHPITLPPA
jgi:hypothetical protein